MQDNILSFYSPILYGCHVENIAINNYWKLLVCKTKQLFYYTYFILAIEIMILIDDLNHD